MSTAKVPGGTALHRLLGALCALAALLALTLGLDGLSAVQRDLHASPFGAFDDQGDRLDTLRGEDRQLSRQSLLQGTPAPRAGLSDERLPALADLPERRVAAVAPVAPNEGGDPPQRAGVAPSPRLSTGPPARA